MKLDLQNNQRTGTVRIVCTLMSIAKNAVGISVLYLMIDETILHQGGSLSVYMKWRMLRVFVPPPHTPPPKAYQPKKEILWLSRLVIP